MKLTTVLLPAVLLGGSALLLVPQDSEGFTTIGGSLSLSQRDVRVFNNFEDTLANDNQVVSANFPGYFGAPQAIWKATVEWGSELHGNGAGDPHQNNTLGSGGANFDPSWQGLATGVGTTDNNISSALPGSGGGVLAFVETPINNGWRMRFYENWNWADGPGTNIGSGTIDLQGVATHEFGHSLGLGHTNVGGSTMTPSINGNGVVDRSIAADDIAGVQSIYGVKSASKPRITGVVVNANDTITITGTNFSATGNQVWFTQLATGGTGSPITLANVVSSAGGTVITVTPPATAGPGDVLVRNNGTGNANLSNAWPLNLDGGTIPGPTAPDITSVVPSSVPAVNVDGSVVVTLNGTGFAGTTSVVVDGVPLVTFPPQFTVSDTAITFSMPKVSKLGNITVDVTNPQGTDSINLAVVANNPPVLEIENSNPLFLLKALGMNLSMGAQPFDFMFLFASPSNLPTSLPGIFEAGIGDNFTSLIYLGQFQVSPVTGRVDLSIPLTSVPAGSFFFLQAGRVSFTFPSLPLEMTNVQAVTVLF